MQELNMHEVEQVNGGGGSFEDYAGIAVISAVSYVLGAVGVSVGAGVAITAGAAVMLVNSDQTGSFLHNNPNTPKL